MQLVSRTLHSLYYIWSEWSKINTQPNNCHIKEWSALIYIYNKYHKTANVIVTALGHFLGQLSQRQNWTVLSSTCIQLLVFHWWERPHTVNMETTGSYIYELPKETHRTILTPNADIIQHTYLVVWTSLQDSCKGMLMYLSIVRGDIVW